MGKRVIGLLVGLAAFGFAASEAWAISVSGTAYDNTETTALITTAYNVALRVNGGTASTTTTSTVDGTFSFASITAAAGDTITIYFYGTSDTTAGTYTGNVVTITDGSTNITGVLLMDDHVVLRSDNGATAITIPDLWDYDNTQNAANLLFDAVDATPDTLSVEAGNELYLTATDTFTPGGNVSNASTGTLTGIDIRGTWTATGTETITVRGNWNQGGTFTAAQGTVDFTKSNNTTYTVTGATTFYNLTLSGTGAGGANLNISDDLIVQNTLTITNPYTGGVGINADGSESHTISVAGNVTHSSAVSLERTLTIVMNGGGPQSVTTSSTGSIGSLQVSNTTNPVTLGSNLGMTGNLTIDLNTTLDVTTANYNITLEGSWTRNGTFTQRQGTVTFNKPGNTTYTVTGATTFYNLTLSGTGTNFFVSDDLVVQNDLTISNTYAGGGFDADGAESHTISVGRHLAHSGTINMEATLTVVMNGTTAQTVTTSSTGKLGDLTISNTTAEVQLGATLLVADDITVDANTFEVKKI